MKSSTQSFAGGAAASRPLIKSMKKVGSQSTVSLTTRVNLVCLLCRFPVSSSRIRAQEKASSNSSQNPRSFSSSTLETTPSTLILRSMLTSLSSLPSPTWFSSPITSLYKPKLRFWHSGKYSGSCRVCGCGALVLNSNFSNFFMIIE